MNTTDYQNRLMWHTIGISNGETRNWFGTSAGGKDAAEFDKLVEAGLAERHKAPSYWGDDYVYRLTEEGSEIARKTFPKPEPPEKLTRSKQRYKDYLNADSGLSFAEYMGFRSA